ncbi:MAG: hypothetical protein ACKOS8_05635, partial [Gemmataceae bacterium]
MPQPNQSSFPLPNWAEGPKVLLSPGKSRLFYNRHPWVFPGAIAGVQGNPADGAVVALFSHTAKFVGWGMYNSKSKVRVRVYSWNPAEPPEEALFRKRMREAVSLRCSLGFLAPQSGCRLINSEADFL